MLYSGMVLSVSLFCNWLLRNHYLFVFSFSLLPLLSRYISVTKLLNILVISTLFYLVFYHTSLLITSFTVSILLYTMADDHLRSQLNYETDKFIHHLRYRFPNMFPNTNRTSTLSTSSSPSSIARSGYDRSAMSSIPSSRDTGQQTQECTINPDPSLFSSTSSLTKRYTSVPTGDTTE